MVKMIGIHMVSFHAYWDMYHIVAQVYRFTPICLSSLPPNAHCPPSSWTPSSFCQWPLTCPRHCRWKPNSMALYVVGRFTIDLRQILPIDCERQPLLAADDGPPPPPDQWISQSQTLLLNDDPMSYCWKHCLCGTSAGNGGGDSEPPLLGRCAPCCLIWTGAAKVSARWKWNQKVAFTQLCSVACSEQHLTTICGGLGSVM